MIAEPDALRASGPFPPILQVGVTADPESGRLTLSLTGDIDFVNAVALSSRMLAIIATRRPQQVIIDVAGVEFCDCAGVRALADLHDRIIEAGIACRLQHPRPLIGWLLRQLGAVRLVDEPGDHQHDGDEANRCPVRR